MKYYKIGRIVLYTFYYTQKSSTPAKLRTLRKEGELIGLRSRVGQDSCRHRTFHA